MTPKKSPHFAKKHAHTEPQSEATETEESASDAAQEEASGYEDEDFSAVSASSAEVDEVDEEDENSYASDYSGPPRKKRNKGPTSKASATAKGKELWRSGVTTGLGPGKQVIIAKPKARPAGKTPYTDDTIHPNTMLFLRDLASNNDREWLKR